MMIKSIKFFLTYAFISIQMQMGLFASISCPYHKEIKAIIFDCDGVLVDTEYLKFLSWQEALAKEKIEFSLEEYEPLVGYNSEHILSKIAKLKNCDIDLSLIQEKDRIYHALQQLGITPIEPAVSLVKQLAKIKNDFGFKLGLASSAPTHEILQNLRQIGIEKAFDVIISGTDDLQEYQDSNGKNKPKPYIYLEAAKRLAVDVKHCIVFEDTTAGIEAAISAQMTAIAVPNSFTMNQDFSKASAVIQSYEDLFPSLEMN